MSGCSAVGCSNRGDQGYFMKSFPRDPERRALWAAQTKRDDWQPNDNSRLCEVHFDDDQWETTRQDGTRRLKSNAVPTLFQYMGKTVNRKLRKPKFIVPLTADAVWSLANGAKAPAAIEMKFSEEQNWNTSPIKTKPKEESSYFEQWPTTDHEAEPSYLSEAANMALSQSSSTQNRLSGVKQQVDICCRLCASTNGESYVPIFGESNLAEKISRCLPIMVLSNDKLPLHVCQWCAYDLNVSYKLIIGSLKADAILRSGPLETSRISQRPEAPGESNFAPKEEPVFRINGPIQCDLCDHYFRDMTKFDRHIETTHLLRWRCSLCDHSFETTEELVAHKTLNHSGQILLCRNCENCNSEEEFDAEVPNVVDSDGGGEMERLMDEEPEHEETETTKLGNLSCTKCQIVFDDPKQFGKHHTIHLPRRLKCSLCRKRCSSIFDYLTHKRSMHNQTKKSISVTRNAVHGCKYCKKVFIRKQHLIVHLRKHKKEMLDDPSVTVYKCVTCPKTFVDRALYQKHRNVHDPACWHKYRCYLCDRSFVDRFKLRIHRSIHEGVKPYQCDVCGHMFNRNTNMIRHRAKHFEQTCRHCQEVFTNTISLKEHLKDIHGDTITPKRNSKDTHDGEKKRGGSSKETGDKYVCRYCGKQLTSNCSLLDHERIHTGDKPYVCDNCGKAFRSITARWDHMVRHEKGNYICELCGKIMSNRLNLTRHLRRHAAIDERKFQCKECGKLFHVAWRLNDHLSRIHHSIPGDLKSEKEAEKD